VPRVTHIIAASGRSIIAPRRVLKWDRYNGSDNDFNLAVSELFEFVRLDVRNRITRRFPLSNLVRWLWRLLGYSNCNRS
jgi:hypothetical protein